MNRVVMYAGNKAVYKQMYVSLTSLLANNQIDMVFLLTEGDFPYELPDGVFEINAKVADYFPETGANYKQKWSYFAMLRCAAEHLFTASKRVLWLDCDTIIDGDITELFEMDMAGYLYAGCKEYEKSRTVGDYINTGVLVMNLEEIRKTPGFTDSLIDMLNREKLECPDQDAINILAKGKIKFLDSKYNVCQFTEPAAETVIYHFASMVKYDNAPIYRKYSGEKVETRTLIAVPCMDMVHTDFMRCLIDLEKPEGTNYTVIKNTVIYEARNMIAQNAIRYGFDRVLWLDSDMIFPKDTLLRLAAEMDTGKDFVTGVYFSRTENTKPVLYSSVNFELRENEAITDSKRYEDYPANTVFECAGAGFGCVMTSVELLKRMVNRYGAPFSPLMGLGEDLSFCFRAAQNGEKMYCDSRIKLGHIGQHIYGEFDYVQG